MKKFLIIALVATLSWGCEKLDFNNEKDFLTLTCARNEIIYKTLDNYPIELHEEAYFDGAYLVSNTYVDGVGRLHFNSDIV